jgi:hypothetical protein
MSVEDSDDVPFLIQDNKILYIGNNVWDVVEAVDNQEQDENTEGGELTRDRRNNGSNQSGMVLNTEEALQTEDNNSGDGIQFGYNPLDKERRPNQEDQQEGVVRVYDDGPYFCAKAIVWFSIPEEVSNFNILINPRGPFEVDISNYSREKVEVLGDRHIQPVNGNPGEFKFLVTIIYDQDSVPAREYPLEFVNSNTGDVLKELNLIPP